MDYEKAYKDALERAKAAIDIAADKDLVKGVATTIFPELCESEDERIRKAIMGLTYIDGIEPILTKCSITAGDIRAWLEKQKINTEGDFGRGYDCGYQAGYAVATNEMKPKVATATLDTVETEKQKEQEHPCDSAQFEEGFKTGLEIGLRKQKEQKHPNGCFTCDEYKKGYEEGRRNGFTAGYNKAMKEVDEQKEQEPELVQHPPVTYTYPSDASRDEQLKMALLALLNSDLIKVAGKKFTKQDLIDWVEKQKPAEWNANDKAFIKDCARILDENGYEASAERLLSMFPEKSAEWSEEDEDMLNCCISSIEEAKENRYAYKETDGDTSYDHEIAWLKSLRPSWKPSEEQMKALQWWSELPSCSPGLKSLYEDLKKL